MVTIPFDSSQDFFSEQIVVEGVAYTFEFAWSFRESCWYMRVEDAGGLELASAIKLVLGINLFPKRPGLPAGALVAVSNTPGIDRIGRDSIGAGTSLVYASAAEVAAL